LSTDFLALSVAVLAASPQNASTFVFRSDAATLSLSLTAVAQTGDLFFNLSAPADYDWVGFGIGDRMQGALTFIAYPAKNGSAVTLSPRLSSGHTEPEYSSKIQVEKLSGPNATASNFIDASQGGQMMLSFVCRNCTRWSNPPLDLTSTGAPFIFAVGPISGGTDSRWFNDPAAPLRSHSIHAKFTMDMKTATVQSGEGITVPELANATVGASGVTEVTLKSHDWTSAIHVSFSNDKSMVQNYSIEIGILQYHLEALTSRPKMRNLKSLVARFSVFVPSSNMKYLSFVNNISVRRSPCVLHSDSSTPWTL
jgi:hypothetical protein